ncbi:MAG: HEPN domain-containing protein [Bacteroidales bacterium]|nr:HEPN domain-containing protein [Bacteroidales bacterium]
MNPDNKDKSNLIKYRLQQAIDTIEVVDILIINKKYPAAVNRIYYGIFYSLLALALKFDFESSKHQQLIGWFNKEFIQTGKVEKNYGRVLRKAYENRTTGDYDTFIEFEKNDVVQLFEEMKQFIIRIEKLLRE